MCLCVLYFPVVLAIADDANETTPAYFLIFVRFAGCPFHNPNGNAHTQLHGAPMSKWTNGTIAIYCIWYNSWQRFPCAWDREMSSADNDKTSTLISLSWIATNENHIARCGGTGSITNVEKPLKLYLVAIFRYATSFKCIPFLFKLCLPHQNCVPFESCIWIIDCASSRFVLHCDL